MIARCVRERRRVMRYRLPTSSLKKLESRKFTKNEIYDTCAICLDDYEEGDRLRWNIYDTISVTKLLNDVSLVAGFCHVVTRITRSASMFGWRRIDESVQFASAKFTQSARGGGIGGDNQPTPHQTQWAPSTPTTRRLWSTTRTATRTMERSMMEMTSLWIKELNKMQRLMTRFSTAVQAQDSKDSTRSIAFLTSPLSLSKNLGLALLLKNRKVAGVVSKSKLHKPLTFRDLQRFSWFQVLRFQPWRVRRECCSSNCRRNFRRCWYYNSSEHKSFDQFQWWQQHSQFQLERLVPWRERNAKWRWRRDSGWSSETSAEQEQEASLRAKHNDVWSAQH